MRPADETGGATAEFAVALPAVLLVLAVALGGVQVARASLGAQDAAADAARSWARGEGGVAVAAHLQRQLPGASVTRSARGSLVCATVRYTPSGLAARLGIRVTATSCALGGGR
ncbi:MAG: TadE family type IV pilus minor pilin [Schumannella sp.]